MSSATRANDLGNEYAVVVLFAEPNHANSNSEDILVAYEKDNDDVARQLAMAQLNMTRFGN